MTGIDAIRVLIDRFQTHHAQYTSGQYNETALRRDFLDPFFEALGWDVFNRKNFSETFREVIHEDSLEVEDSMRAPDYCFRLGGRRVFFVEAKKPSVNLKEDVHPAYQVRRYAWSAKLPVSILTDFQEFAVYDCRIKPVPTDKASMARVMYLKFDEYSAQWDALTGLFSPEAIQKGALEKFVGSTRLKKGTAQVDDAFLEEIEGWRELLAKSIALRNDGLSQRDLNFAVQRTIDRVIFLRICEDRGIETYATLREFQNGANIYERLVEYFRRADERYNSGLFHFRDEKDQSESPDTLTPRIKIDDKPLKDILKKLYYPDCPYEFSVLGADILGSVYERFLGKVIRLTAGHRAVVEEKPEVRKAGGVYYTPTYIVDYIVKNTVGKLLEGKTPKQAAELRILDPACGSGSFLLGAYQCLLGWHAEQYVKDPNKWSKGKDPALYKSHEGDWKLTTQERKRILLNNIYGVDIDSQAVEVTKLSLLLKVLEGESGETISKQLKMFHQRALPDLGSNIKCGNSLIGPDFYQQQRMADLTDEDHYRINVFDWTQAFSEIMKRGGFDAVIGNPPYIFTRELIKEYEKNYYNRAYNQTQFKINTYFLFVERGFYLLKQTGQLGFILPNNWLTLETTSQFRRFILTETHSIKLVNICDRVFGNASVDTSLLVFCKSGPKDLTIYELEKGNINQISRKASNNYMNLHNHIISYEVHQSGQNAKLCQKVSFKSIPLEMIAEVRNGIQAYTVGEGIPPQTEKMKNDRVYHSLVKKDHTWKKYVDGVDVGRYRLGWSKQFVKYGKNLSRPRKDSFFQGERVLIRQIPSKPPYSILSSYVNEELVNDNNSMIVTQPHSGYDIKYLIGILNSRLISFWFIHSFGKLQRKVFPQFKVKELRSFPIHPIKFSAHCDKALHDQIVQLADSMIALQKQKATAATQLVQDHIRRQIDATDRQIDQLVYDLYGLTDNEIAIVEGAISE